MKKFKIIFIAMILCLLPSFSYSSNIGAFRISFIKGEVKVKTENTTQWISALMNLPLMEGDSIWIPKAGRLEIQMRDGSYLRFDENSSFVVRAADRDSFQFYLEEGHAYVNFMGGRDSVIEIETPVTLVRAHERSRFRIDLPGYGNPELSVFKGVVYAEDMNGTIKVRDGKTLSIGEDNYADISPLGLSDEWERWNRDRNRRSAEQLYSARYLPEELRVYSHDFDNYGKWVYSSKYGYVWKPTVVVSSAWSPYRIGRWSWIGGDYVWVSYEPWGWVPYHYGRWNFRVSIGWFWVPPVRGAVYWGPGHVGWVHTPSYVAWVPLAPEDIYYGYGYYGPRSVNIININVRKKIMKKVYKNVYVDNAVTVVHRKAFVRGRHRDFTIAKKKNPFLRKNVSFGRPEIKPDKTSFKHIVKKIQRTPKHSQSIKDVRFKKPKKRTKFTEEKTGYNTRPSSQKKTRHIRSGKERIKGKLKKTKYRDTIPKRKIQIIEKRFDSVKRDRRYKKSVMAKRPMTSDGSRYETDRAHRKKQEQTYVKRFKKHQNSGDKGVKIQKRTKGYDQVEKWSKKKRGKKGFEKHKRAVKQDKIRTWR